uniref:Ubiquitin-like domain-containing protein n=1 Tax=Varanus komodoensis TaxID=61221 RepID=A0A8D2LD47_VARKO
KAETAHTTKIPGAKLAAAPEPQVVRILVKTPWQQEEFLVHRDMLVREFKELVARHFSAAPKHVVLVQAGRILKDHKALGHHGALLEADATVYVVVRSPWARPSRQASAGPPGGAPGQKPSQSSTSAGDGLRALTASLGLNTATFAEFQSRLMSHPDIMLRLLEDPSIQSKLSSPSLVKELLTNSRPVQQVIKSAPEISHVFSSPEGVRLVMELARNPAAVREILKSPPQALGCPSGDGNSVLQDTLAEARAPGQNAVPKWRGAAPWPVSLGGHQPPVEPEERPGWAREPLPSLRTWPTRPGALGEHSSGESGPWKGAEAGQLASAAVRNLLRQIIRHLVQSTMGSPSRNAAQAGTPVPGPDVLPPGLGRGPDSSAAPSPCGPLAWGSWPEHAGLWGPGLHAEGQEGCLPLSLSSTSLCPGGSRPDEGGPFSGLARPLEHGAPLPAPGVAGIPAPGSAEIPLRIVSLCNAYTKHMMLSLMWGSLLAQMRSPEMVAAMANPKAIQAWVQMEQGLQTLLAEAPVLVPWFMLRLRGLGCSAGAVPWPQDPPGPGVPGHGGFGLQGSSQEVAVRLFCSFDTASVPDVEAGPTFLLR